jgi:hypothetical protein
MIRRFALAMVVVSTALVVSAADPGRNPEAPTAGASTHVGAIVCKTCHGPGSADDAFTIWSVSKHSRTYVQLGTGYVQMIDPNARGFVSEGFGGSIRKEAARLDIDTDCLRCHTTAYGVPDSETAGTFHIEDGVQCEACHGPGGDHIGWAQSAGGAAFGERPAASRMRVPAIEFCAQACHRSKPTHAPFIPMEFDAEAGWRKIAHGRQTGQ